jgi:signal transduction histidine kinase
MYSDDKIISLMSAAIIISGILIVVGMFFGPPFLVFTGVGLFLLTPIIPLTETTGSVLKAILAYILMLISAGILSKNYLDNSEYDRIENIEFNWQRAKMNNDARYGRNRRVK